MDKKLFRFSFLAVLALASLQVSARENIGQPQRQQMGHRVDASNCNPASSQIDLNINNVRARLMNGGDMWWDLVSTARYEVPKVNPPALPANSMFAGSIWIGGIDENNQLKVAAQTYRQSGNDFFPGPLDGQGGTTTAEVCTEFDHHWQVFGSEIDETKALFEANGNNLSVEEIPSNILNWPGRGNPYNNAVGDRNLAPFYDFDGDGNYDPTAGDYPIIGQCESNVYADQMIWWVYNDNGNIHTESSGLPIGMEVHALAFAFQASDEINDMTFYRYKLINKSSNTLNNCYMGQWADPDLGNYIDDYIGCDTAQGLGINYNADPNDEPGGSGGFYGNQPPLIGIDYFQGPLNEKGEELGMSNFLYYNNDFSVTGNPQKTSDYYGYLSGKWTDGTPFTEGGTAYGGSVSTHYVFPDVPSTTQGWSECEANNKGADRRMIESSGPFKLLPGASNDVVVGVVWVRPPVGTYAPCPTYNLLLQADLKAQALFKTCFKVLSGPPPPDVRIIEQNKKLILAIEEYTKTEGYRQADPVAKEKNYKDSLYRFEGYQVYQLKNSSVSNAELIDPTKAQLLFQCDIKNGVTKVINNVYDASIGATIPKVMVNGEDKGIRHTFEITSDAFASSGSKELVNLKKYYFLVLPYAYNGYAVNDTTAVLYEENDTAHTTPLYQTIVSAQQLPYLPSRIIHISSGIPHITEPEFTGLVLQSDYGDGPEIIRHEGRGNGGLSVELTPQSVIDILNNTTSPTPIYKGGKGPVNVTVYDAKKVPDAKFQLVFRDSTLFSYNKKYVIVKDTTSGNPVDTISFAVEDTATYRIEPKKYTVTNFFITKKPGVNVLDDSATWSLQMIEGDSVISQTAIREGAEQPIPDWGLSVYIKQVKNPAVGDDNSLIDWSITYQEPFKAWLSGVPDVDNSQIFNWILAGTYHAATPSFNVQSDWSNGATPPVYDDPTEQYENIFFRTVAPYRLCSMDQTYGAILNNSAARVQNRLDSLPSIDLVFTPDKEKWTRCVVIETCPDINLSQDRTVKMAVRRSGSVNKDGLPDGESLGYSWFPGYAINPETGVRLNIMFGEDSWQAGNNGRDMRWNPTSDLFNGLGEVIMGGRHWIYVMKTKYDSCHAVHDQILLASNTQQINTVVGLNVYKNVGWVAQPMLAPGFKFLPYDQGFIPTETTLKIRVTHAYERYAGDAPENKTFPRYTFSTSGIAARKETLSVAKTALDTIKVVPNPYYAYAGYETGQLDTRVKIANLPIKCTISIYSLDGTLIRRFNRDDNSSTFVEWDLKNHAGVPIAGGMYLVHIDAPGIGEKTIKWFGVLRPIDLDSF